MPSPSVPTPSIPTRSRTLCDPSPPVPVPVSSRPHLFRVGFRFLPIVQAVLPRPRHPIRSQPGVSDGNSPVSRRQQITFQATLIFHLIDGLFLTTPTIRYDTRCYFNVRSKADMSQLNLPHGNDYFFSVKQKN